MESALSDTLGKTNSKKNVIPSIIMLDTKLPCNILSKLRYRNNNRLRRNGLEVAVYFYIVGKCVIVDSGACVFVSAYTAPMMISNTSTFKYVAHSKADRSHNNAPASAVQDADIQLNCNHRQINVLIRR